MASFKDMCFTPAEFATLAKIDRNQITDLENRGLLTTFKRRVGNVDRKMITLEAMQNYFKSVAGATAAGPAIPVIEGQSEEAVATATGFNAAQPKHKIQMFYNVKGGTGKSTLSAQYVMR